MSVYANLVSIYFGVHTLVDLYFALLGEICVPHAVSGTTVGLTSVIGYTPKIVVGAIVSHLIDNHPGVTGDLQSWLQIHVVSTIRLVTAVAASRGILR